MKRLVVLGAGTAGTIVVNKLRHRLRRDDWEITVVDQDEEHVYQPGLLLVPFGATTPEELVRPRRRFIPSGVDLVTGRIERVDPHDRWVKLDDGDLPLVPAKPVPQLVDDHRSGRAGAEHHKSLHLGGPPHSCCLATSVNGDPGDRQGRKSLPHRVCSTGSRARGAVW